MGAWEAGSFDNDDAMDWVGDFTDEPTKKTIKNALAAVISIGDEYLEAPDSSKAIAAAEVIAALKGAPHPKLPEELQECLAKGTVTVDQNLVQLALMAIERIRTNSELKELWDEGDPTPWLAGS